MNTPKKLTGLQEEELSKEKNSDSIPEFTNQEAALFLASLVDSADDAIIGKKLDGTIVSWNSGAERLYGYTASEAIGANITIIAPEDRLIESQLILEKVRNGEGIRHFETTRQRKDGSPVYVSLTVSPVCDTHGRVRAASVIAREMSERKFAEEALKKSEEKYRIIVETSHDIIWSINSNGYFSFVNQASLNVLGYTPKEMINRHFTQFQTKKFAEKDLALLADVLSGKIVDNFETELIHKDGHSVSLFCNAVAIRDENKNITGISGTASDITARKQIQETIRKSEEKYRTLFEESKDVVFIVSADGTFLDLNQAGIELLGAGSKTGATRLDLEKDLKWDPEDRQKYRKILQEQGYVKDYPIVLQKPSGQRLDLLITATAQKDNSGQISQVRGIAKDITALKRTEEALKESERRYRSFVEDDLTGIYISNVEGKLLTCNPAFLRMFGFESTQEALNYDLNLVYKNPDDRKAFVDTIRVEKKLEYLEHELVNKKGEPLYVVENAFGIFNEKNELVTIKGYIVDTTDRKKLEEQLIQVQKMEAIGRLAGGVAHDFNNILMAITSYIELLLIRMHELDPLRPYVCEIRKAAEQGGNLTGQLLAFSRRQVLTPKSIDLNDSIVGMENMLNRLIGDDIKLEIVNGRDLGTVRADPGQIEQILMNLAVNARDAMPGGGTLRIETSNFEVNQEYASRHAGLLPGSFVLLSIQDTGHGMKEETVQHIFEPFFTTKQDGKGTGLGLSTVFGIVKQSGGFIYVESKWGAGTTITILLPRIEEPAQRHFLESTAERAVGHGETILLVDDNEMVRTAAGSFLEMNGYRVLYAANGPDAITLLRNEPAIDLMLSDVVMPEMSGTEVAEAAKELCPQMKTLFMSGYTDEQAHMQSILSSGCDFISKPVMMTVLLKKIRELLSS